jgi:hypothetical protein
MKIQIFFSMVQLMIFEIKNLILTCLEFQWPIKENLNIIQGRLER